MGLIDFFRKKEGIPKAVERVFEKMKRELEGKKLADQAISCRNLGNFEKAFSLLRRALTEFDYKPAILLIGTTAVVKGDINGAIEWFTTSIEDQHKRGDAPLIELYANLGSIYCKHRQECGKAIDLYRKALDAPRPPIYGEDYYLLCVSAVHRDMAVAFQTLGSYSNARAYAVNTLQVDPDCSVSKAIISFCDDRIRTHSVALNRHGQEGGTVENQPDGRFIMRAGENSDFITVLMSLSQIAWEMKVSETDKLIFSRHMNLSDHSESEDQREVFSLAMLHYFVELKKSQSQLPEAIAEPVRLIPECVLPALPQPLSDEIRSLLLRVY